jgi:hypothetical protein
MNQQGPFKSLKTKILLEKALVIVYDNSHLKSTYWSAINPKQTSIYDRNK